MSQNREPPAYQEYPAPMLSKLAFRTMSMQERGLLYTLRLECWVNKKLPRDPGDLAKVLGLPPQEVADAIDAVMPFFMVADKFIYCPELEDYRQHLEER